MQDQFLQNDKLWICFKIKPNVVSGTLNIQHEMSSIKFSNVGQFCDDFEALKNINLDAKGKQP